jgi:peptidoglycan/LPS O-acetylase OafA/YrhL
MSRSSLALDNLRAIVILIVLSFHAVLAYVKFIPVSHGGFSEPPFGWRAFPIMDEERWFGFDLFCAWQDVYLMSLMFLLSGLFVWPSLNRKGNWGFLRDRFLRLGVPFLFGVIVLTPIAVYPAYLSTTAEPSLNDYIQRYLALPFLPNGQVWFLWQLVAMNVVLVAINAVAPGLLASLVRRVAAAGENPVRFYLALVAVGAAVYVPVALILTPWAWTSTGPLSFQYSRPLLYMVFFFTGLGIGARGIDDGLMASDGALLRHWRWWLGAAIASLILWMGLTSLTLDGNAPLVIDIASDLSFVIACAAGCFFMLAVALRFGTIRSPYLDSLSANAYSLYLVHYVFMVWLQYALLSSPLFAVIKGSIVFATTLVLSWITTLVVQRVPFGARLIGAPSRGLPRLADGEPAPGFYERLRQFVSH